MLDLGAEQRRHRSQRTCPRGSRAHAEKETGEKRAGRHLEVSTATAGARGWSQRGLQSISNAMEGEWRKPVVFVELQIVEKAGVMTF
jgi:hypothetical protein